MPAIRSTHQSAKPLPITFIQIGTGIQTPIFRQGDCVCKACKSTNLTYIKYLQDAKCDDCSQWQNEDLLPA